MMKECGLNEGGKVQTYIDSFIFDRSKPYLPGYHIFRDSKSANLPGSGEVIWDTPDAQFLFEGKLMVGHETLSPFAAKGEYKILDPNGRDLTYHGGGLRGKDWINRMMKDEEEELIKGCEEIVNWR
jgi:hypothetical protein